MGKQLGAGGGEEPFEVDELSLAIDEFRPLHWLLPSILLVSISILK